MLLIDASHFRPFTHAFIHTRTHAHIKLIFGEFLGPRLSSQAKHPMPIAPQIPGLVVANVGMEMFGLNFRKEHVR